MVWLDMTIGVAMTNSRDNSITVLVLLMKPFKRL